MSQKYAFILKFQDCVENEIEIYSDEEIEGHTPSLVETNIMKGIFDSYEEAKKAAEEFKVLKVIVTHDYDNGDWIVEEDSVDDFEEPFYFFSYIAAESWAYSHTEDNGEYEDDEEENHTKNSTYEIVEIDILDIEIIEIS